MQFFDLLAVQDLVSCLQEGRSHLRLQGLSHVQGGCMVVEPFCNVLQFSMQLQQLQNACFEHVKHILETIMKNKVRPPPPPFRKKTSQHLNFLTDLRVELLVQAGHRQQPAGVYLCTSIDNDFFV